MASFFPMADQSTLNHAAQILAGISDDQTPTLRCGIILKIIAISAVEKSVRSA